MEPGFDLNTTMLLGILISGFLKMSLLKLGNTQITLWIQIKVNFINGTQFNCPPIFFSIQSADTANFQFKKEEHINFGVGNIQNLKLRVSIIQFQIEKF